MNILGRRLVTSAVDDFRLPEYALPEPVLHAD
jgi:hypothetical protein